MVVPKEDYTYIMPDNQEEIDRLRNQHEWVKGSTGGVLLFAPLEHKGLPLKVLDSATADGLWCLDVARELPQASFVGFDIADHLFPSAERLPQNLDLKLVKADLMDDFPSAWNDCFDLVHQRFIWASLPNPAQALEHLIKATKRGGWVQLVDVDLVSYPESQHQPHAFSTLRKLARALFADPTAAGKQAQWLKDSGLVNVDHTVFDIAAGSGHKDPELGLKGSKNIREVMEMFMQAYVQHHGDRLGLETNEWEDLPSEITKEMETCHLTVRIHVAWGQKSLN